MVNTKYSYNYVILEELHNSLFLNTKMAYWDQFKLKSPSFFDQDFDDVVLWIKVLGHFKWNKVIKNLGPNISDGTFVLSRSFANDERKLFREKERPIKISSKAIKYMKTYDINYDKIKERVEELPNIFTASSTEVLAMFDYISQKVRLYWSRLYQFIENYQPGSKEYPFGDETKKPYKYKCNEECAQYYRENLEQLNIEVNERINEYFNNTSNTGVFDLRVMTLLRHLASMRCMDSILRIDGLNRKRTFNLFKYNIVFPVVSETGNFGFNTWLFAFFHHFDLAGVPLGISEADGNTECPAGFWEHDEGHIGELRNDEHYIGLTLYQKIHASSYSDSIKEIILFGMWYILHELQNEGIFLSKNELVSSRNLRHNKEWNWIQDLIYPKINLLSNYGSGGSNKFIIKTSIRIFTDFRDGIEIY